MFDLPETTVTDSSTSPAPFFIAKILFSSKTITNKKDDANIYTVELVRKGQDLAQLIEKEKSSSKSKSSRLICGKHTLFADDEKTVLANIDGYPLVSIKKGKEFENVTLSIVPLISIANDAMEVSVTLYPPVPGCEPLNSEELLTRLQEQHVQFGLNPNQLQELVQRCNDEQTIISSETVSRGLLPLHGKDSFLRFDVEVGPLPGKILGNGKIDFRERKMFVGVQQGETIATRIPPTSGTPGINVLGEEITQLAGRELKVTVSNDAEFDEGNGIIRALQSGILSMVNENSIKVCAKQVIPGDVDFSTGNIESKDAVDITGSIQPGFKVETHGDLLIGGSIRSAFVHCMGNLVIQNGITGGDGNVEVEGDADFKFIEQGKIQSGGRVIIRKQAYHSTIMADSDICAHEKSTIIGGMLLSGGSISLGTVGSPNAPPTLLAAGVSPEQYLEYEKIRSHLHNQEEALLLCLQRHGQKVKNSLRQSLEESVATLRQALKEIYLSPGSSTASADEINQYLSTIRITLYGNLFSGTVVQIGRATKTIKTDLRTTSFRLDRNGSIIMESNPQG